MTHANTKRKAIAKAKARVSGLIYCKGFDWQYAIDGHLTQPAPHKVTQYRRSQKLVEIARHELGLRPINYIGGSWINYV